jgi:hypothetical protein
MMMRKLNQSGELRRLTQTQPFKRFTLEFGFGACLFRPSINFETYFASFTTDTYNYMLQLF